MAKSNKPKKTGAKRQAGIGTGMGMNIVRAVEIRNALKKISPKQALQPSAVDELRGAMNVGATKMLKCFVKAKKVKYDPKEKYYARLTANDVKETLNRCFR